MRDLRESLGAGALEDEVAEKILLQDAARVKNDSKREKRPSVTSSGEVGSKDSE